MANRNLDLLKEAARLLRPLLGELVFVGGCTTVLLINDEAAAEVRPTYDVDAIAEITSYAEYAALSERLRQLGFAEDHSEGAPICRWVHGEIRLDVMPTDERILGFSNRWYKPVMENAQSVQLASNLTIRVVTAPKPLIHAALFKTTFIKRIVHSQRSEIMGSMRAARRAGI